MSAHADLVNSFNRAQAQLVVQMADLPLGTLADMVESNAIDLEPGFQRRERWKPDKQSALIESFLLNVPVPPIYLSEEQSGTFTAIDGKQRLKAITDYIHNRFPLKNLERLREADGLYFRDMPSEIVNSIKLRPFLRVVTLLKQTDSLLKYEVFLRLNRGGESLNAQEIRNVAFRGALNDAIYRLSETDFLRRQLKIDDKKSAAYREMSDAEFVLRFLTLKASWRTFSGSLVQEMDNFMRINGESTQQEIAAFSDGFSSALRRCEAIWGDKSFRRPEGQGWRDQTLAGMYDAQMIAVSLLSEAAYQNAVLNRDRVIAATRALFDEDEFDKAVKAGTNTPARIRYRVDSMRRALENL